MSLLSHFIVYELGKNNGEAQAQRPKVEVKTVYATTTKEVCLSYKQVPTSFEAGLGLVVVGILLGVAIALALKK